jgi:hypothetical protein
LQKYNLLKFVILGTFLGDETRILSDIRQTIKGRKKKKDKMKGKCGKQNLVGIGGVVAVLGTLSMYNLCRKAYSPRAS